MPPVLLPLRKILSMRLRQRLPEPSELLLRRALGLLDCEGSPTFRRRWALSRVCVTTPTSNSSTFRLIPADVSVNLHL